MIAPRSSLLLAVLVGFSGCVVDIDYGGTQYRCDDGHCPAGMTCSPAAICVDEDPPTDGPIDGSDDIDARNDWSLIVPVAASDNDAQEMADFGTIELDGNRIMVGSEFGWAYWAGVRFVDLAIPPGSAIVAAEIQFAAAASSGTVSLGIFCEQHDNAPAFSTAVGNILGRTVGVGISWSPPDWVAGQAGAAQRTPDLGDIVQAVVDRPGWAAGNALVFVLEPLSGTSSRRFKSFDGLPAPELRIKIE